MARKKTMAFLWGSQLLGGRSLTPTLQKRWLRTGTRRQGQQAWDPERYRNSTGFVAKLGESLLDGLPAAPARVLDLGCGEGALTEKVAALGHHVIGVDSDPAMVASAKERGLDARVLDAAALPFEGEFDAVLTNAVLHWIPDHAPVLRGVRRALRPGGVFVGECGGLGNVRRVRQALADAVLSSRGLREAEICPWNFPDPSTFGGLLEQQGFSVSALDLFDRPVPMADPAEFVRVFGEHYFDAVGDASVDAVCDEFTRFVVNSDALQRDADGRYLIDYVRLRWLATKDE